MNRLSGIFVCLLVFLARLIIKLPLCGFKQQQQVASDTGIFGNCHQENMSMKSIPLHT